MSTTIADRVPTRSICTRKYAHALAPGPSRRLQALAVAGWSRQILSTSLGLSPRSIKRIAQGGACTPDQAERIEQVFNRLRSSSPAPTQDALSTRREALYQGWVGAAAWTPSSIDNPDGRPLTARTVQFIEDIEWMVVTGESLAGICRRSMLSAGALYRRLIRAERLDLWHGARDAA